MNAAMEDDDTEVQVAVQEGNQSEALETKVARTVEAAAAQREKVVSCKRCSATLLQKAVSIHELDTEKGVNKIEKKFGITGGVVSKIVQQRDNILAALVSLRKFGKALYSWKYLFKKRQGKSAELEEKVMEWFMKEREDNHTQRLA